MAFLTFVRPTANSVFNINDLDGLKLLTKLVLCLSDLRYQNFRYNFQDFSNPICDCGLEIKTVTRFLLKCPLFQSTRQFLLLNIKKIDKSILKKDITKILLNGDDKFELSCNKVNNLFNN